MSPTEAMYRDRWCQTTLAQPMFNFPKEKPRNITAADIVAILIHYKRELQVPKEVFTGAQIVNLFDSIRTKESTAYPTPFEAFDQKMGTYSRRIFRRWPRAPNGVVLTDENGGRGKEIPNGIFWWGSSLYDLYQVRRKPGKLPFKGVGFATITSGSKLLAFARSVGELDAAKEEIEFAKMEPPPRVIEPWSPCQAIQDAEECIRKGEIGKPIKKVDKSSWGAMYEHSRYPDPWPLVPFSYPSEKLTSTINPLHLPKTLIIHDPRNCLAVDSFNKYGSRHYSYLWSWSKESDQEVRYNLSLSPELESRLKREQKEAADPTRPQTTARNNPKQSHDINNLKKKKRSIRLRSHDSTKAVILPEDLYTLDGVTGYLVCPLTPGPVPPPVFAMLRSPPRSKPSATDKAIEEAHLYLSPNRQLGEGHHSIVYHAELELPRSFLIPPPPTSVLCKTCLEEDVERVIREKNGEGKVCESDHMWQEKNGIVKVLEEGRSAPTNIQIIEGTQDIPEFPSERTSYHEFEGVVRPIRSTVLWQDPAHPTCGHLVPPPPVPPTVKVHVVAKVSMAGDDHLEKEGMNYQRFPDHMFQHWSGYNVIPPMYDPVPLGPIVPQFYGFYKPDESLDGYFSSILLMEDCGRDVRPEGMTIDQRLEGMSLLCRFHYAYWSHGSIYPRNIVYQAGPLTLPPSQRSYLNPSFRLIDFGRTVEYRDTELARERDVTCQNEKRDVEAIFGVRCSNARYTQPTVGVGGWAKK